MKNLLVVRFVFCTIRKFMTTFIRREILILPAQFTCRLFVISFAHDITTKAFLLHSYLSITYQCPLSYLILEHTTIPLSFLKEPLMVHVLRLATTSQFIQQWKRLVYVWPQLASNLNWFGAYQLSFSAVKNKNVDLMYEFICIILLMFPRIFSISTDKPKTHLRLSNWSTRLIGVVASSPLQRTNSKTSSQCSVIR